MLSGVTQVKVQFLQAQTGVNLTSELGGDWVPRWPMARNNTKLPLAVQVDLDVDGIGTVTRIVGLANEQ
ncbi:conserved hypothetical protein [Ricinus communis]|uniref:Uncharacterized protein n=1 Tax=Ricinus communis TaxID=3988 RepID=B9TK72_RICCO|nr:conserved hypothetical protein [Ricinus communis]